MRTTFLFSMLVATTLIACSGGEPEVSSESSVAPDSTVTPSPDSTADPDTAQTASSSVVRRDTAGSMSIPPSDAISADYINAGSDLQRRWITVIDTTLPVEFVGSSGIRATYDYDDLVYQTEPELVFEEPVEAYELRYLTFNVWRDYVGTLSANEVQSFTAPDTISVEFQWDVYPFNEARRHWASIAYVARVRTEDGEVLEADPGPVLREARQLAGEFSQEQLSPVPDSVKGGSP